MTTTIVDLDTSVSLFPKNFAEKNREMKTVLITGANKGIGFETAKQLAQLGYFVYLGSRDKKRGMDAITKLKGMGISTVELIDRGH
ncbi:MAG TPA: SDR family NAD(P)-dependent oxidoreductase [Bacteroidales bacterium]